MLRKEWENPKATLTPSVTAADLDRFYGSENHLFAIALQRLTGWTIQVILSQDELDHEAIPDVVHLFCEDAQGNFWDARGIRPPESVYDEVHSWASIDKYVTFAAFHESELKEFVGYWGFYTPISRPLTSYDDEDIEGVIPDVRRLLSEMPGYKEQNQPAPRI